MSCEVELLGFQPDGTAQQMVDDLEKDIEILLDGAPSDSYACVTIRKGQEGFNGILDIHSEQGEFVAKAWGSSLAQVRSDLFTQIRNQLSSWRDGRFEVDDSFDGEAGWLGGHHGAA